MRTGTRGLALIKEFEGLETHAYKDAVGVWTIGYGHTASAGHPTPIPGMVISSDQAEQILRNDLVKFEKRVEKHVRVPLTQDQFDALVSFDFNTGAIDKATLTKRLNNGAYGAVPEELRKWVKAGGKTLKGLVRRRDAECALWSKGSSLPPAPPPPDIPAPEPQDKPPSFWSRLVAFFKGQ